MTEPTPPPAGPQLYPAMLVLAQQPVVVVGGGAVAARKAQGLLSAQPRLTVIAPEVVEVLGVLAAQRRLTWLPRHYQPGDLRGARLAFAATDDVVTNRAVWREARRRRVLVNVADDPSRCTFTVPAVLRHDDLAIAVSTGSASPALAALVRDTVAQVIGPEYGTLIMLLAELRQRIQKRELDRTRREAALRRLASVEVLEAVRGGDLALARQLLDAAADADTPSARLPST